MSTAANDTGNTDDVAASRLRMRLTVLLPHQVLLERTRVGRIIVETPDGSFGLLPRRLDCVCALTPGIVVYDHDDEGERYVAIDEGVLTKAGPHVQIAVRRAIAGTNLAHLKEAVAASFLAEDEEARSIRQVMNRLEGSFMLRLVTLHHG